jgi:tetratricopeptide (TPR) repeat protein
MAEVAASVLVLAAISAVAVIWRRKRPWLLTGWCWFLGTMVPVIGLVQIGKQSMADRYTYIPLVGIFIMVVWGLGEIAERRPATRRPLAAAATAALAACMVVTFFQARTWRNGMTLFTHALLVTRNNSLAHDQVGLAYYKMGRLDDAMAEFDEALKIEPDSRFVIYHQGMVLARQDKVHSAMGYYYAEMDRRGLSYSTNSPPR